MEVIAEGVETLEQATKLRTFGCGQGQGYFFARPSSVEDAERLLRETAPVVRMQQYNDNVESLPTEFVA
jgi:EAL domain-containing protein (putative c-di-GMP-specific phosphodiesterase class I)